MTVTSGANLLDGLRRAALVFALLLTITTVHAVERRLDPQSLQDAIALGRTGLERSRIEFHRPYRIAVGTAPVDEIEVVTPFRRIVLAAEARLKAGERLYGQREALETLGDTPEQIDLVVQLTFHPLNVLVGVPSYEVSVRSSRDGTTVPLRAVDRIPRFGPRVEGVPATSPTQGVGLTRQGSQPLLGGSLVIRLDGREIDPMGAYDVTVWDGKQELATRRVNFGLLR